MTDETNETNEPTEPTETVEPTAAERQQQPDAAKLSDEAKGAAVLVELAEEDRARSC